MAPLTKDEIDILWGQLQSERPRDCNIPARWLEYTNWATSGSRTKCSIWEFWMWNATHIMIVLAANDALDIPE